MILIFGFVVVLGVMLFGGLLSQVNTTKIGGKTITDVVVKGPWGWWIAYWTKAAAEAEARQQSKGGP